MSKEIFDKMGEEFLNKFTATVMEIVLAEVNEKDEKKFGKMNAIICNLPVSQVHTGITEEEKFKKLFKDKMSLEPALECQ